MYIVLIAAIANPIMCVGFCSAVFVSVVFASPLFLPRSVRESSNFRNKSACETSDSNWESSVCHSGVCESSVLGSGIWEAILRDTRQQEGDRYQILSTSGKWGFRDCRECKPPLCGRGFASAVSVTAAVVSPLPVVFA